MAEKFLKLQGVVDNSDLKHVDMVTLVESVKDAGGKTIQLGKLKDWIAIQGQVSLDRVARCSLFTDTKSNASVCC